MSNAVLQRLVTEREGLNQAIDRVLDKASEDERELTDSDRELIKRHKAELERLEPQIGELLELEETRTRAADARSALTRPARQPDATPAPAPDAEPEGHYRTFAQWARDALLVRYDEIGAQVAPEIRQRAAQRLERAVEPVLLADVPGLNIPQHISELYQTINKERPLTQTARVVNLTSGTLTWPKITVRPTVAQQVTEKTEVGVGTMTVILANTTAKTFLSSANFSWQTITWSNPDALALWFDLAAADYAKKTDAELAAKLAAADASPTVSVPNTLEGWSGAIAAAAGRVYAATGRRVDTIYSDVVTGYGIMGLASAASPVFFGSGGANLATGTYPSFAGLKLVISANLPADTTVVGDSSAIIVGEVAGSPVQMRAVEPSIGGMEVGIIGAYACELLEPTAFDELHTAGTLRAAGAKGKE